MVTYYMVDGQETELIYNLGNMAWIIVSTALVFIMIPGLGFFYAGLLRKKSALSMIWMSMAVMAVVTFEWFFWGFSLAFSQTANNPFIGVSAQALHVFLRLLAAMNFATDKLRLHRVSAPSLPMFRTSTISH